MFSNFSVKYFEMISIISNSFPVDSIVSSIYETGVLSDRTWQLDMAPVLWAHLRPLMEYF